MRIFVFLKQGVALHLPEVNAVGELCQAGAQELLGGGVFLAGEVDTGAEGEDLESCLGTGGGVGLTVESFQQAVQLRQASRTKVKSCEF